MLGAFVGAALVGLAYLPHWKETEGADLKRAIFCTTPAIRCAPANFACEVIGTFVLIFAVLTFKGAFEHPLSGAAVPVDLGAMGAIPIALVVWAIGPFARRPDRLRDQSRARPRPASRARAAADSRQRRQRLELRVDSSSRPLLARSSQSPPTSRSENFDVQFPPANEIPPRSRQGTTSSRAIVYERPARARRGGAAGIHAAFSAARMGRARRGRNLAQRCRRPRAMPWRKPASPPTQIAAIGITEPTRDCRAVGSQDGPAHRAGHRVAGPPHFRIHGRPARRRGGGKVPLVLQKTASCWTRIFPRASSIGSSETCTGARARAAAGELAAGTIDSWLIFKLTGGREHVTDVTKRLAHDAHEHPFPATGTTSCSRSSTSRAPYSRALSQMA